MNPLRVSSFRFQVAAATAQILLILAASAEGATYYVAMSGSDSNPGTQSAPFRAIRTGIAALQAGDTLRIRGGEYTESVDWTTNDSTMPLGGTSWGDPIIVEAASGELVEWYCAGSSCINFAGNLRYIIIRNITFDGSRGTNTLHVVINQPPVGFRYTELPVTWAERIWSYGCNGVDCPKYLRFEGNEVRYTAYGVAGAYHDAFEYRRNYIHHVGKGMGVAFYVAGPDTLFDGNVFDTLSNTAISFWCQGCPKVHRGLVQNNVFRNVGVVWAPQSENGNHPFCGTEQAPSDCSRYQPGRIFSGNASIFISQGDGTRVYNNILIHSSGILPSQGATNCAVYNNTIYGNPIGESGQPYDPQFDAGIALSSAFGSASNCTIRNNIVHQPGVTNPPPIYDSGTNTVLSHNLCSSAATGCTSIGDPQFVNASAGDFRLRSGSPAIDAGMDLRSQGLTADFEGTVRPQGIAFELGAYEFGSGGSSPSSPTLTVTPLAVSPGGSVQVSWNNLSNPTVRDWLGLYASPQTPANDLSLGWVYTSSCTTGLGALPKGSGTCVLIMPTTAGSSYEVRLFPNDQFSPVLATSPAITVTTNTPASGDLDGDGKLTLTDVRWMIQMLVGTRAVDLSASDLTQDGKLSLLDVQTLIKRIVGVP